MSQAKRLKEFERESTRLRRAVSDLTLDKLIRQEAARRDCQSPSRRRCVEAVCEGLSMSEQRICKALGQYRAGTYLHNSAYFFFSGVFVTSRLRYRKGSPVGS